MALLGASAPFPPQDARLAWRVPGHPSPLPPCLPPRGRKGQRKTEGAYTPTLRMRGARRARGGLRSPPSSPSRAPKASRACPRALCALAHAWRAL